MGKAIEAVFDGKVFRPLEVVTLKPNTKVILIVESISPPEEEKSFLEVARSLDLEGPPDWSERLVVCQS
ncbi:MAG: hypothetical protein DRI61_14900 [Chloroflexi bacterium]|nr:MAG: hypothetical protein DRI61_14900 [Chloroflexota bacterium]HDN80367.1 DUF104 domain-containing protein [Chloroflexota bacterium]